MDISANAITGSEDSDIANVLQHHYGDGDIYIPEGTSNSMLRAAIHKGYLSEDGYLTRKGRELLAQFQI